MDILTKEEFEQLFGKDTRSPVTIAGSVRGDKAKVSTSTSITSTPSARLKPSAVFGETQEDLIAEQHLKEQLEEARLEKLKKKSINENACPAEDELKRRAKIVAALEKRRLRELSGEVPQEDLYVPPVTDPNSSSAQYTKLNFESSAELLCWYDDAINSGAITLHSWQVETSETICKKKATSLDPFEFYLCAANGSGKDAYIVAGLAIWFACTKIRSRTILTSSSGVQLKSQTENYIADLAKRINAKEGIEIFKINQRHIVCTITGSEIIFFATDDAGKAEGYHPHPDYPGAEMLIIINEAKSVQDKIFEALERCTGYNYWVEVSTPGDVKGHFYKVFNDPLVKPESKKRVTAFECPHLGSAYISRAKRNYGEASPLYRSMILALFTSIAGQTVISQDVINYLLQKRPFLVYQHWAKRIGIDLAAGGDETSVCITRGNGILKTYDFVERDTTLTTDKIEQFLLNERISKQHEYIFADDGGVGHGVIDQLIRRGWIIKRVLNQHAAVNKKLFANKGAELWWKVSRIFQEGLFNINNANAKLLEQLANRHYETKDNSLIRLESKADARSEGRPSPDRADAFVLSLADLTLDDFLGEGEKDKNPENKFKPRGGEKIFGIENLLRKVEDRMFDGKPEQRERSKRIRSYSLNDVL